jgi:putative ABC transport system substrate-binding protein
VAVIVAAGTPTALAAKAATTTIPIVFYTGSDPVASGLVAAINRPGGNLTGSALLSVELGPKRLQLLHEVIPDASVFGALASPLAAVPSAIADVEAAARALGLQLVVATVGNDTELEAAFVTFSQQRVRGVVVSNGPFYNRRMDKLAALAATACAAYNFPIP